MWSSEQQGGKPMFSMHTHFHEILNPNRNNILIEMSVKLIIYTLVRYQHDDAPPHTESFFYFVQN